MVGSSTGVKVGGSCRVWRGWERGSVTGQPAGESAGKCEMELRVFGGGKWARKSWERRADQQIECVSHELSHAQRTFKLGRFQVSTGALPRCLVSHCLVVIAFPSLPSLPRCLRCSVASCCLPPNPCVARTKRGSDKAAQRDDPCKHQSSASRQASCAEQKLRTKVPPRIQALAMADLPLCEASSCDQSAPPCPRQTSC